jgi:MFS transporter, DHA1 family, multidrug resistance protein
MTDIRRPTLAVLIAVTMISQLAMNIVLPSQTGIAAEFAVDFKYVQLNVSLYLIGTALAQLIYGPLSDRYGRRLMILIGLGIFLVGSVMCVSAFNIEIFIVGRAIQAVGSCAGFVMGRAMVRDMYPMDQAAAKIADLTSVVVIVPGLAPLIGGYFEAWYGWRASMWFVLVVGVLVFLFAYSRAHETLAEDKRHEVSFAGLLRAFPALFRNPVFSAYALQASFNTGAYFVFLSGSSYVFVSLMGGSSETLGLWFLAVTMFYIAGNLGTSRYVRKFGVARINILGVTIALAATFILMIVFQVAGLTTLSFFGIICFLGLGNGFCISSGVAGAISADPSRVGAAAGLSGSMQLGFSGLASWIVSVYLIDSAFPLILAMALLSAAGFVASLAGARYSRKSSGNA